MKRFFFRWGLIIFGLFAIFTGASEMLVGEKLDETAKSVTGEQALAMTSGHDQHFVQIDALPVLSKRVYTSALSEPRFVDQDTSRQYPLDPFGAGVEDLIGQTVAITGTLDPRTAELQTIEYDENETVEDGTLKGLRVFVPVLESAGKIVLMSPGFYSTDDPDYAHWLSQASFTGVLSRLEDLPQNRPSLESTGSDVRAVFAGLGIDLAPDATIIFTDTDGSRRARRSYAPLDGSANAVFVEIPPGHDPAGNSVTGMIRSARASAYSGFAQAFGEDMPTMFAIVDISMTAADINAKHAAEATTALTFGIIMVSIGGFWVFLRRKAAIKRAEFQAQDLEDLDLINAAAQAEHEQFRGAA